MKLQPLTIKVERLKVPLSVGIYDSEKRKRQVVHISATLILHGRRYDIDDMKNSVDYDVLCAEIKAVAAARHYELIENLALHIGRSLKTLADAKSVQIRIDKPLAARKNGAETICVIVDC
jgi:dihydroneopterin aldolase